VRGAAKKCRHRWHLNKQQQQLSAFRGWKRTDVWKLIPRNARYVKILTSRFPFQDRVTKPQKKMLITLLRETKYMEGKKEKEWYWEKIQAALNTIGPKKTIIQWKKVS